MTTSYQEVQYASRGRVSQLDISDPICQKIHITKGPRYRHSGGPGIQRPEWSPPQLTRLTAVSPTLQARINKLRANGDGGSVWLIQSRADDGIYADTASHVLDMIAFDQPATNAIEDEAAVLSRYCNILWFFEVIPSNFPTCALWERPDTASIIDTINSTPPLRHAFTNGTDYNNPSLVRWCWSHPTSPTSYQTALHIANFALILDRKEDFRRAIKQVIWETGEAEDVLATPVKYLKRAGPDGIDKSRKREMEQVLSYLSRYLLNCSKTDKKNVDATNKLLTDHGIEIGDDPGRFYQPSVYQLLRDIEAALLPPPPPPAVPAPGRRVHARQPTHGSSKTNSSSGSHHSGSGANGGPSRQDTAVTSGTSRTHKSSSSSRRGGSGGAGGSNSSLPSSPPAGRPLGPSLTDAVEKLHKKLSTPRREPKTEPAPDPAPRLRGELAAHAEFVRVMLQETHNFVLDRQAIVAEDMLARRDLDVASWEERLLP